MMLDRRLQQTAQAMIAAADTGEAAAEVLAQRCPRIHRQIAGAKRCPAMLALWGRSVNFDENAQEEIVHPAVLQAIGALADLPMGRRIVHAGLQHTYGYLFSLIETPFGYKRERWTRSDLDDALGFTKPTLRAVPSAGTLLSNLTYFLGRILGPANQLQFLRPFVATAVCKYPYEELRGQRIVEEIEFKQRKIVLNTHLVAIPRRRRAMHSLLIYSCRTAAGRTKLFTTFPVAAGVAKELLGTEGEHVPICLRFNAYLPGMSGKEIIGRRTIKTEL